jgi:hypothetical protein
MIKEQGDGQLGIGSSGQGWTSDPHWPPLHGLLGGQLLPPLAVSSKHCWVGSQSSSVEQGHVVVHVGRQVPEMVEIVLPVEQAVATNSQYSPLEHWESDVQSPQPEQPAVAASRSAVRESLIGVT